MRSILRWNGISFCKFRCYNSLIYHESFKSDRKLAKRLQKRHFRNFLFWAEMSINNDPGCYCSYINQKRNMSRIPNRVTLNDRQYSEVHNGMDTFAIYFKNVYILSSTPTLVLPDVNCYNSNSKDELLYDCRLWRILSSQKMTNFHFFLLWGIVLYCSLNLSLFYSLQFLKLVSFRILGRQWRSVLFINYCISLNHICATAIRMCPSLVIAPLFLKEVPVSCRALI